MDLELRVGQLTIQVEALAIRVNSILDAMARNDWEGFLKGQERILQLIDGDESRGMLGMRKHLAYIGTQIDALIDERNKLRWIIFGVGIGEGLLGSGIGHYLLEAFTILP